MLLSKSLSSKILKTVFDPESRDILIRLEVSGELISLCNLYAPTVSPLPFFAHLTQLLSAKKYSNLVVAGNNNATINPSFDCSHLAAILHSSTIESLQCLMTSLSLVNVQPLLNTTEQDHTCYSKAHATFSRIDYFLIADSLFPKTDSATISSFSLSDYSPITLSLNMATPPTCKFPTHLTNLDDFKSFLQLHWAKYFNDNIPHSDTPVLFWHTAKTVLRSHIISYIIANIPVQRMRHLSENTPASKKQWQEAVVFLNTFVTSHTKQKLLYINSKFYKWSSKIGPLLAKLTRPYDSKRHILKINDPYLLSSTTCPQSIIEAN